MQSRAQGATEYLVLLAVVLIVALVSVALLGFFPGMASDAQITQSETYWKSAQPIAVVEWAAKAWTTNPQYGTYAYLRIRNSGAYPIRITKMIAAGQSVSQVYITNGGFSMSDYFYMAPGEEKYFGYSLPFSSLPADRQVDLRPAGAGSAGTWVLYAASPACSISPPYGVTQVSGFGFEYIEYIEGQQITKQEVGAKPIIIRCAPPF